MQIKDVHVGEMVLGRYTQRVGLVTRIVLAGFWVKFPPEEAAHCYHPLLHLLDKDGNEFSGSLMDLKESQ